MIWEFIYIVLCIVLAFINWKVIEADKRVYHGLNGVFHLVCWVAFYLITRNIILTAALPFIARLFFDVMLNCFRGLPLDYVSSWVKNNNPRASKTDRLEWQIFKDGLAPKAIYLVIIIALNVWNAFT
jgi:hypothetical protein